MNITSELYYWEGCIREFTAPQSVAASGLFVGSCNTVFLAMGVPPWPLCACYAVLMLVVLAYLFVHPQENLPEHMDVMPERL